MKSKVWRTVLGCGAVSVPVAAGSTALALRTTPTEITALATIAVALIALVTVPLGRWKLPVAVAAGVAMMCTSGAYFVSDPRTETTAGPAVEDESAGSGDPAQGPTTTVAPGEPSTTSPPETTTPTTEGTTTTESPTTTLSTTPDGPQASELCQRFHAQGGERDTVVMQDPVTVNATQRSVEVEVCGRGFEVNQTYSVQVDCTGDAAAEFPLMDAVIPDINGNFSVSVVIASETLTYVDCPSLYNLVGVGLDILVVGASVLDEVTLNIFKAVSDSLQL